jgi:hypothetical protein
MLNTIGMSESILKLIEKRSKTDMLIFLGLVLLTIVLIYILISFVKPMLSLSSGGSSPAPPVIQATE